MIVNTLRRILIERAGGDESSPYARLVDLVNERLMGAA